MSKIYMAILPIFLLVRIKIYFIGQNDIINGKNQEILIPIIRTSSTCSLLPFQFSNVVNKKSF